MTVLVTGAAGFIGFHLAKALLEQGRPVIGLDNLNDYYDPALKQARLDQLAPYGDLFTFHKADISDRDAVLALVERAPEITEIVNLAAQAGVRYSLENPHAYTKSNVEGHLVMMEAARLCPNLTHFVYASTSSVYGMNKEMPFSTDQRTDGPVSLYAATKKSCELMSHCYSHLYDLPMTGLRFFTVYGPWGRPDMSPYIFCSKIMAGEPIPVFNNGEMQRDFTYVEDIVAGVIGCMAKPPAANEAGVRHAVYNIGNNKAEPLMRFIQVMEEAVGKKAEINFLPMQDGDVVATFSDIEATKRDFGYAPSTSIDEGLPAYVTWFKSYYGEV